VGRSGELERVGDVLAAGERSGVVLAGRAGVGKTRLATECLALAEARTLRTARVTACEASGRLRFGALAPLLPPTSGPGIEPADMLRRAVDGIAALGLGRPLVLLVDDAHLLDDASATLVHQLAATRSAFVVATVRAQEPAPDPVVALWKDELAARIDVPPLAPASIEALLTGVLGGPVSAVTLHELTERSAGNALYLRELVLGAMESGALSDDDGIWRLSGSVGLSSRLVELIEARLAGVHDPERKVLDALAFGEPLGVSCLLTLTSGEALEILEDRGLIVTGRDGRRLEARLAHPLYGEVIRARIPALRARQVTQSLARRVRATGARRREDALRFATWSLDAGGVLAPELMVKAACTARNRWDLGLAERLADAAVQAGAGFDAALLRAEVAMLLGRADDAEAQLAALLPQAGDDLKRARLTAIRVDNLTGAMCRHDEGLRVAQEAESLISERACQHAVRAKRGLAMYLRGHLAPALDVVEPLLAQAEGAALVSASYTAGACLVRAGRLAEAIKVSEVGREAASRLGEPHPTFRPSTDAIVRCSALLAAGHLDEAEERALVHYADGVATGAITVQAVFSLILARVHLARGDVTRAGRHAGEARNLFRERRWLALSRTGFTYVAHAHALGGSAEEARAALAEIDALDLPEDLNAVELLRARGWADVAAGDLAAGRSRLHDAIELARSRGDLVWEAEILHDLARLGQAPDVRVRLGVLARLVEGPMMAARADHAAALDAGDAPALVGVSAAFESMGAWLLAAEAAADAAVSLRRQGDGRRATGCALRAATLARQCEGASTPALRAIETRAVLSAREIEVAALAAAGLANKEIAGRLSVSVRTVENQLQRVYGKLGLARRAELAEALQLV
jgi:DNA-binding CsgD family transcriptional regulator